jgi:hypothetical protein
MNGRRCSHEKRKEVSEPPKNPRRRIKPGIKYIGVDDAPGTVEMLEVFADRFKRFPTVKSPA